MIAAALAPPDEPARVGDDPVRARHLGLDGELPEIARFRIEAADLFPIAFHEPDMAPRVHGQVVGDGRSRGNVELRDDDVGFADRVAVRDGFGYVQSGRLVGAEMPGEIRRDPLRLLAFGRHGLLVGDRLVVRRADLLDPSHVEDDLLPAEPIEAPADEVHRAVAVHAAIDDELLHAVPVVGKLGDPVRRGEDGHGPLESEVQRSFLPRRNLELSLRALLVPAHARGHLASPGEQLGRAVIPAPREHRDGDSPFEVTNFHRRAGHGLAVFVANYPLEAAHLQRCRDRGRCARQGERQAEDGGTKRNLHGSLQQRSRAPGGPGQGYLLSIALIVSSRLRRMRLKDRANTPNSSLPDSGSSGTALSALLVLPRLSRSAAADTLLTGRTIRTYSIRFRMTNSARKTPPSEAMNVWKARFAFRTGRDIGTETSWAPMTSFSCQPKPLSEP